MQAFPFLPKLFQKIWGRVTGCVRAQKHGNIQYLFSSAVNATLLALAQLLSLSAALRGSHTVPWLQSPSILSPAGRPVQTGRLQSAGSRPRRPAVLALRGYPLQPRSAPRLNYKAFICHTTRLLLDVAPHVSLCAVRARVRHNVRPPAQAAVKCLVDPSGRFSQVITSCAFLSRAHQLLKRNLDWHLDTWEGNIFSHGQYFMQHWMVLYGTCFFKKANKKNRWSWFLPSTRPLSQGF